MTSVIDRGFISALAGGIFETTMRRIGFAVLITVVSLIAPLGVLAGEGTKEWSLLEPPVDETSNVLFGTLNQAPLTQWNRVATYDTEATCENKRSKAIQASREENTPFFGDVAAAKAGDIQRGLPRQRPGKLKCLRPCG